MNDCVLSHKRSGSDRRTNQRRARTSPRTDVHRTSGVVLSPEHQVQGFLIPPQDPFCPLLFAGVCAPGRPSEMGYGVPRFSNGIVHEAPELFVQKILDAVWSLPEAFSKTLGYMPPHPSRTG